MFYYTLSEYYVKHFLNFTTSFTPFKKSVGLIFQNLSEWCGFEIKLGAHQIDAAAANLLKIRQDIRKDGGKEPVSLCVVCGLSNAAYQREDGVFVVPVTALKN